MSSPFENGVAPDPRTEEQKKLDYQHSETAGDVFLTWMEKPQDQWKKYTPREQDGSLSCCGQSAAKALEVLNCKVNSAHPIYRSRSNYPDGGMYLANIGEVTKKVGTTTEVLAPSQSQNESTMNRDISTPTPIKIEKYAFPNPKSIDQIAEAIELYKHCLLIFHCSKTEWTSMPTYNGNVIDFGHCVCAVDYFLKDGKKAILIEDSTGHPSSLDGKGQRVITEDFLQKRCDGAIYFIVLPKYIFTKLLKYGMKDSEVIELQKRLGVTPQTGYFGPITLSAVKNFQTQQGLTADGVVGSKTREKLNG